jgi:hypothetical protein
LKSLRTVIEDPVQDEAIQKADVGSSEDRGIGAAAGPLQRVTSPHGLIP